MGHAQDGQAFTSAVRKGSPPPKTRPRISGQRALAHAKRVTYAYVMMFLRRDVLSWYRYDVSFSAELIDSFVEGIEKQAAESIVRYQEGKQREVVEDVMGENEEKYVRLVETHQGLDDETWDLATIFGEYFPSLQRRSALLTVYGYFEHELDKLCSLYQSEKGFRLALSDLSGQGIDRSTNYLEKVAGLNVHKASQEWTRIKAIQTIRNVIAHRDGRLRDRQDNSIREIIEDMDKTMSLTGENEIVLEAGFLSHVVDTYKNYFRLISESIKAREKA